MPKSEDGFIIKIGLIVIAIILGILFINGRLNQDTAEEIQDSAHELIDQAKEGVDKANQASQEAGDKIEDIR